MFDSMIRAAVVAGAVLLVSTAASAGFIEDRGSEPYRLQYGAAATLRSLCAAELGEHRPPLDDLPLCRDRLLSIVADFGQLRYSGRFFCLPPGTPPGIVAETIADYLAVNKLEWPVPAWDAAIKALVNAYSCEEVLRRFSSR